MQSIDYSKVIENDAEIELYKYLANTVIQFLANNNSAKFGEILRFVGGSDRRMLRLLNELVKVNIITFENGRFHSSELQTIEFHQTEVGCPTCNGLLVSSLSFGEHVFDKMKEILDSRPSPTFLFDQRPVTLATTIRRVAYMAHRGDLINKRIAIIGDDDLTGIAIAFSGLAKEIKVFEIDKRLISYIEEMAQRFDLDIKCINYDVTKPLPEEFLSRFDVFLTDPTPELVPFTVFVNTGINLLAKNAGNVGYLSFYSSAMMVDIETQKNITRMNLIITDLIPKFTEYSFIEETFSQDDLRLLDKYAAGKGDICFHESLCRVVTTTETKAIPLSYKLKQMMGKATVRSLTDFSKDPSSQMENDQSYLAEVLTTIQQDQNRLMYTGEEDEP